MNVRPRLSQTGIKRIGFYSVAALFCVLLGLFALVSTLALFTDLVPMVPSEFEHFLHDIVFAAILWSAFLGMVVQLRNPRDNVGGIQQSILVLALFVIVPLFAGRVVTEPLVFVALTLAAAVLHPRARDVLRVRPLDEVDRVHIGLVAVAAIPLVLFALGQLGVQRGGQDPHALLGHWSLMAAFAVSIIIVGLLGAMTPAGGWLPTLTAGGLAAVYGITSVVYPTQASSAGILWGVLAVIWGIALVAAHSVRTPDRTRVSKTLS